LTSARRKLPANLFRWRALALDLAALFAGASLPLAFAPFALFPVAIFAPAILFWLWCDGSAPRAARRGFLFGLGAFGVGVSWVYVSLHDFGHMPPALAGITVVLFVAILSAYLALIGALQAWFAPRATPWHLLGILPALWVLAEWVRSWLFTGFPWLHLGYSQIDTPLAGLAPWLGVYGVSWAVAIMAGAVVLLLRAPRKALRLSLGLIVSLWVLAWLGGMVRWVEPTGNALPVALVQGNIPLRIKWLPEYRDAIVQVYLRLSREATDAKLIVWPESAIPGYLDQAEETIVPSIQALAQERDATLIVGVVEKDDTGKRYYNSAISIGEQRDHYRKRHLVPFGEFMPLKWLLGWLINNLHIPMSDFSSGAATPVPIMAAGEAVAVSICYEDAFGEEVIAALPGASLLVNLSEDAWFGDSLAPHQRLQMARMRAREAGRPMLRAANTGPSAVIDAQGNVVVATAQFQALALTATVTPMRGRTPYVIWGNGPVIVAALCLLLLSAVQYRHRKHVPPADRAAGHADEIPLAEEPKES